MDLRKIITGVVLVGSLASAVKAGYSGLDYQARGGSIGSFVDDIYFRGIYRSNKDFLRFNSFDKIMIFGVLAIAGSCLTYGLYRKDLID